MLLLISGAECCCPSPDATFGALFGSNLLIRGAFFSISRCNHGPISGAAIWTHFRGRLLKRQKGAPENADPFLGPEFAYFLGNNFDFWGPDQVSGDVFCEKEALA